MRCCGGLIRVYVPAIGPLPDVDRQFRFLIVIAFRDLWVLWIVLRHMSALPLFVVIELLDHD